MYSYFRPPKGAKKEEARKWTEVEKELLIKGIEKHGIGSFGEISKESLPKWVSNNEDNNIFAMCIKKNN